MYAPRDDVILADTDAWPCQRTAFKSGVEQSAVRAKAASISPAACCHRCHGLTTLDNGISGPAVLIG